MKQVSYSTKKIIALFLFITIGLIGCAPQQDVKRINLSDTDPAVSQTQNGSSDKPLRIAVSSVMSPKETLDSYSPFLNYLQKKTGKKVTFVQRQSYQEINDLIKNGDAELAFICSGAYVTGQKDAKLELLAVPSVNGKATYQSLLIVSADSKYQSLEDLQGKVFAFTDPISYSGKVAPTYMIWKLKQTPETFFKRYIFTYSHDNSIRAVSDRVVDGAAVDSLVYQYALAKNPQLAQKVRVIDQSDFVGSPPVVVSEDLDPKLKDQLKTILLNMNRDPDGQEALRPLLYDGFIQPSEKDYDPIRNMLTKMKG